MAFVAPLAVAAGASAATAAWISVGVSVAMLVGSWLYFRSNQEKNDIFDPGAQEMPRFNQALRGATLPVYFGTNRAPSHIVWTKNFTTIRKETDSGGGGKFGGSGFGSKTPAGGGEVTYEYKWDLLFHIGMVPEPYNLFGGWLGSDRLDSDTILAITNGAENIDSILFLSGVDRPNNASLRFSEGYYSPGVNTGDTNFTPWAYYTAQKGLEHWWPSTAYVGFKQLSLGGQPHIPQLTWEFGPGGIEITTDPSYIGNASCVDNSSIGGGYVTGDDSKQYIATSKPIGSGEAAIYCLNDGTKLSLSAATFEANLEAYEYEDGNSPSGGSPLTFTISATTFIGIVPVIGANYFLASGLLTIGADTYMGFGLYKINSSGSLAIAGAYISKGLGVQSGALLCASVSNAQTTSDPIVAVTEVASAFNLFAELWVLPSITRMLTPYAQTDSGRSSEISASLQAEFGNYIFADGTYFEGVLHPNMFFLPYGSGTRLYVYVNKSQTQGHIDNVSANESAWVNTNAATYPNGFLAYIDLGTVAFPADDTSINNAFTPVIANDDIDEFPFDDAWLRTDDTTTDNQVDYYQVPTIKRVDDVALIPVYVVIFTKKYEDSSDLSPIGTRSRARAYIYNSVTGTFIAYGKKEGITFDTVANMGATEGNRYSFDTNAIATFYVHETQKLVQAQHTVDAPAAAMNDKLVISQFGDLEISGGADVYPPYIIRQILVNPVFGLRPGADIIDEESYQESLDYCEAEEIKVSTGYLREEGSLRIIELLLSLYGGYLVISGGKIKFGRQEVVSPVRTIDNHHLVREGNEPPVKITRGALQDAANKVKVNYIDRALEYRQNFVEVEDPVDIDIHGVRAREFPPQFVMSEATARKLAVRALWSGLYARDQYSFVLGPKDSDLEPGDVVTLVDSYHLELQTGVYCRLTKLRESKPGRYEWIGVTEYAEYNSTSLEINSSTNISSNVLFGPAKPPLDFRMYELPKEFQGANPQLYVGWVPGNFAMGARLYVSPDNVTFAQVLDVQPYIIAGRLQTNLASTDMLAQNVEVYLFPSSGFSASSPTFTMTHALDDVSQAGRAVGAGLIWVGSEMLGYQGVTLLSQNRYRFDKVFRGWGGTYIHAHSVGDYWWKQGGGVFAQGFNEDKVGTTLYYKVSPYNFAGVEYNVSSIDAKSYQIQGTYYRPQNCPAIHTYIDTPVTGTRSEDLRGLSTKAVTSGGCMIFFDWSDASRMEGYGQGGYGAAGYGHFASDTTSHSWRVEVSSSNGFVVRSVSVSTTYYEYDRAVNSADFNGWKGAFTVRVTPYNTYGDALVSGVKSLNLFG
jgi:hypothetical protein